MKNQKLSEKTMDVLLLLVMTLVFMVFGIMSQSLGNYLAEGVYTHHMIRYWGWVLLFSTGAVLAWKALSMLSHRYPDIYKRIQTLILLVLLIFNIYVAVVDVLSNFAWNRLEFHREEVYIYALQQSNLIGRTAYNASWNELRALCSLKAAVRRGKIQLLVIPSLENLHMAEARAVNLLLDLMAKGIKIALKTPENIQSEEEILFLPRNHSWNTFIL